MSLFNIFNELCYNVESLELVEISLIDLVRIGFHASKIIMDIYNDFDDKKWGIKYKNSDNSPVTAADLKANEFICTQLVSKWPKIPVISEESEIVEWEIRKSYKACWFVDPLDGTKEFIKRNGEFTVNIGLAECGVPTLGLVCVPVEGTAYISNKNLNGTYKITTKAASNLICDETIIEFISKNISEKSEINVVRVISSPSSKDSLFRAFVEKHFQNNVTNSRGSSIKFIEMIEGNADVYPRFLTCMEWDTCACHIIIKQTCGEIYKVSVSELGEVPEFSIEEPLVYNKESMVNPFFVAINENTKKKLMTPKIDLATKQE
ncbi:sulfite synthesis pathway [Cryptosporidium xiaoi]|uniref:Sulfite synthesis pathway n=1 Tax=Cryptosporidium xiaoi TaxID=659607 RepID=A0AAV9Y2G1_9CRYT